MLLEHLEGRRLLTADGPGDQLATAQMVSHSAGVMTEISQTIGDGDYPWGDVDLYRVSLQAGNSVSVDIDAAVLDDGSMLSSVDTLIRVFHVTGIELTSNDLAVAPNDYYFTYTDPYLTFNALATGDYYIGVSSTGNNAYDPTIPGTATGYTTGDYVPQLVVTGGDSGNQAPTASNDSYAVTPGGLATARRSPSKVLGIVYSA